MLIVQLDDRYRISNIGSFLYSEKETLSGISESINVFFETNQVPKLRKFLLKELADKLSNYAHKLESTRNAGTIYID